MTWAPNRLETARQSHETKARLYVRLQNVVAVKTREFDGLVHGTTQHGRVRRPSVERQVADRLRVNRHKLRRLEVQSSQLNTTAR